jgi:putative endopeptidase
MDRSVDPKVDFYKFACGTWIQKNPVPSDKSRWSGFEELQERNWFLVREILESCAADAKAAPGSVRRQVGDFFASAMDTNRIESLKFKPIEAEIHQIDRLKTAKELFRFIGAKHLGGSGILFASGADPDEKESGVYAFHLAQGGLSLPDRDYYLADGFAKQRDAFRAHIVTMLQLFGEPADVAAKHAATVIDLETELAKASKTRVERRDPNANYNKLTIQQLEEQTPNLPWQIYFEASELSHLRQVIVGQTNFFLAINKLVQTRPIDDWKVYLRWHVLSGAAPYLHREVDKENFAFFGTTLRGQPQQETRWQRAAKIIDGSIGEAVGKLYVEKNFPPAARTRMSELVENLRVVFHDRLANLDWMSEATRKEALKKFDRFTRKIGHPDKFRDYSRVKVRRDEFYANVKRAGEFESRRQLARLGQKVDREEWGMTPQTVNAYFNPLQNEIVFPAGILQPPFFDVTMDDAVNYGAIGVVIGHEITHGYDDQGRQFDAEGNLREWWTEADAAEFKRRAQKVVDQYSSYEALPGARVNGQLTLGENLADLGGTSIAYEAMERALAKDPSKRKLIDGFTPEQRFFLSLSQLWRVNWREAELRRRLVVDPHSPAQFRGIGPHVNMAEFYDAFGIKEGDPVWRTPELRAKVW